MYEPYRKSMWSHVTDRYYAGKGEIMRRAIVGNSVGVRAAMMLVLALVVLIGAGPAMAAQDPSFKTIGIDFYKFGSTTNKDAAKAIISASAILCASDVDNDIFANARDGKLDVSSGVGVSNISSASRVEILKTRMRRPIMANFEPGDNLVLATLIEGVTASIVTDLRNGPQSAASNTAMQEIISWVTADFSAGLFADHTASSVYSDLSPTYATTTFGSENFLKLVPGAVTHSSTTVVVFWEVPGLVVSATDSANTAMSYSATMALFGGVNPLKVGKSNFVGIETGLNSAPTIDSSWENDTMTGAAWTNGVVTGLAWHDMLDYTNKKGTKPGVSIGIRVRDAVDTTTKPAYGLSGTYSLNPSEYIASSPVNVPFQFRKNDTMTIELQIDAKESLDGEPDEYFGLKSDSLNLAADGTGVTTGDSRGAKIVVTSEKTDDGQPVLKSITFDTVGNPTDGSNQLLDITAAIRDTVVTSGSYKTFKIKAAITDEVGSSTDVSVNHYVDTAAPMITAIRARARDEALKGGDIGGSGSDADAIFGFEIDGNGETNQTSYVNQWLGMSFESVSKNYLGYTGTTAWNTETFGQRVNLAHIPAIDYNVVQPIAKSVIANMVSSIPSSSPKILGASVTIRIQNNVSTTINSGGLIVSVSDDARNMAVVYADKIGTNPQTLIDTTQKWYSVTDFKLQIANELKPATVEIDNSAPVITNAWVSVSGLPSGYSNGGIDTGAAFELLRSSYESVTAAITTYPGDLTQVIRGTAAIAGSQAGSPLRLVIQFDPSDNLDDTDSIPWTSSTVAANVAAMNTRYDVNITSSNLGYTQDGNGANVDYLGASRWSLADATIVVTGNNYAGAVGWATFYDTVGIPKSDVSANGLPWDESSSEGLSVTLTDRAGNDVTANTVNGIILDTRRITITGTPYVDVADPANEKLFQADANATEAPTLLAIVNQGGNGTELTNAQKLAYSVEAAIDAGYVKNRILGKVAGATAVEVRAGDTIIVGANFSETEDGAGAGGADRFFNQVGGDEPPTIATAGFPFLMNIKGIVAPDARLIDAAATEYGTAFKTLSADFSDFINSDAAKDVLPDVSYVVAGTANINTALPGDTINAKWFFYIDGAESLNLVASTDIRQVTLAARDLSGNVSRYEIKVGTAAFAKPLVTVLDYEINNKKRGISRAVIQRDSSYLGGANVAAISLSQATMNISNATIMLVAKVGDGSSKGGPFTQTGFLYANLSSLGGSATQAPTLVTNANGVAITDGRAVGPADIIYATWITSTFNTLAKDTAGAASAKISVHAVASSGGVGDSASTTGIQVDFINPDLTTSDITEANYKGVSTAPTGDVVGDGIVRPNQIVTVSSSFAMDAADKAKSSLIQFNYDFSQIGSGITPVVYTWSQDTIPKSVPVNNDVRGVTYEFRIPTNTESGYYKAIVHATDAAGNDDWDESDNFVTVISTQPSVQSIIVAASNVINFATDSLGLIEDFREISSRNVADPANTAGIYESTTIVRGGDILLVTTVVRINDDVFTNLDITADFSEFSGSAYKAVVPAPYPGVSDYRIMQGTRVSGNVVYATWVHHIPAGAGQNVVGASVRIDAVNPVGIAATGPTIYSWPLISDNAGPEVSAKIVYSKNGVPQTGAEINPNIKIEKGTAKALQVGNATALIVVSATYTDADTNHGYASSILSAMFREGSDVNTKVSQDVLFDLNTQGLTDNGDPSATYFAFSDKSGVYSDSGSSTDGPVITSASAFLGADAANSAQLRNATDSVLNVWYGFNPKANAGAETLVIKDDAAKKDAVLTFSAIDTIGNKTSKNTSSTIEIDGQAPTISIGRADANTKGVTMSIAPGQTAWEDYVPALYAGSTLLRPTRVSKGTVVRVDFHLWDEPDRDDLIHLSINGTDLHAKANTFTFNSPILGERTDITSDNDYVYKTDIDPSKITGDSVDVSIDIPINWDQKTNDKTGTTIPLVLTSVDDAVKWSAYKTGLDKVKSPEADDNASVIVDATDTIDNWNYEETAVLGFEIDTEGPGILAGQEKTFFVNTLDQVHSLKTLPVNPDINARAGTWLVWAATLVVDGTEDANFPLDKFTINWKEVFEFDTDRLENDTIEKGKSYLVSSATRSILFVTQTVKINDDADPRNVDNISYHLEDLFGNVTEGTSQSDIAISAVGPGPTEIAITVDGKTSTIVGPGALGIGNMWPDSLSADFEVYPGAQIIVEATITTYDGRAPDTILMDASDFYPAGMWAMTNELIPSVTSLTDEGTIYARWEYVAYDVNNLLPSTVINGSSKTFFDQSNLNQVFYGKTYTQRTGTPPAGGRRFNGPIKGATKASKIDLSAVALGGAGGMTTLGGPLADSNVASNQAALNSIKGLPYITVQKDATAKKVAWVTVFVDDDESLFPFEEGLSNEFTVDTEPPRASIIYRATQALTVNYRFMSGPRIGFPTAPNATSNILKPAPRVREKDNVAVIIQVTNALIDGTGNDSFRPLPGYMPANITTGMFKIDSDEDRSIRDVTADLSGFSNLAGMNNLSIFEVDPPDDLCKTNIVTIDSQGIGLPDIITATYTLEVTSGLGTSVLSSNDPVEVTVTVVDDAGNRPNDTAYDKNVLLDNNNAAWRGLEPRTVLAVDNKGPSISGSVEAMITEGTATTEQGVKLTVGDIVKDKSTIEAGTKLRVVVTVSDQVDHPLDLIIDQNNFGEMKLYADGLKLARSVLDSTNAQLGGPDSIRVPFDIEVPSKETGKSTVSFQFIIRATDTVGNMTQKKSTESFAFDANPDVEYYDADGALVSLPQEVTVNASEASMFILSASALDVGGIQTLEWIPSAASGITFTSFDLSGNEETDLSLAAGGSRYAQLDLYATIPIVTGGVTPFSASAVVTDIDGNTNEAVAITVNINQPALIDADLVYNATTDNNVVSQGSLLEIVGLGYNSAFEDIREVTIEEGTTLTIAIVANDSNVSDIVTLSATGTAIYSPNIIEGASSVIPGLGAGLMEFSFKPGFLAVTGDAKSATFDLEVQALDGSTIAPDTSKFVFNVIAKYATPVVTIESIVVDGTSKPATTSLIELNEGSSIQIVMTAQDPGNAVLEKTLESVPSAVPATLSMTEDADGITTATYEFTADYQSADVPEVSFESAIDPLYCNFVVSNASYSNKILIPIDIVNVSQAPLITATATVDIKEPVLVADKGIISAEPGQQVVIEFNASDPDGDAVLTNLTPVVTAGAEFTVTFKSTGIQASSYDSMLTIKIPATVAPADATVTIAYTAKDSTQKQRTTTYKIVVDLGEEPVEPTPGPAEIDNLLVGQSYGGDNRMIWRNIDSSVTDIDGKPVAVTSSYRSMWGAKGDFLDKIGGGADRALYMSTGDVDGDGDVDVVVSLGAVTVTGATYPNIVVAKDGKTRELIGNSFVAWPKTSYANGQIRIAVGNFIGSTTADQIAVAQGTGGANIIRIFQYTGQPAPNGFAVIAQFNGLSSAAVTNNADGGLSLAAGDLNGDGNDELVVGQTNSATSRTQFTVIDINADGTVASRMPGVAFTRKFQGNGGVEIAVVDLDGNGVNELVFASAGNTKDFTENIDNRNDAVSNVIAVQVPVVSSGVITGYTKPSGFLRNVFPETTNPSGAQTIAAIEADGLDDGTELVIGTNAVFTYSGTTVTSVKPAAQARYTFIKIGFDGTAVSGVSSVIGQAAVGFPAFPGDLNPSSGGVYVGSGNTD